ncbi:MAG: hypothetical protein Q8Q09_08475 [Deltaproteobacteria bacterium]|nr:hypothetical protein [Deltaproteobacteria bacterium]
MYHRSDRRGSLVGVGVCSPLDGRWAARTAAARVVYGRERWRRAVRATPRDAEGVCGARVDSERERSVKQPSRCAQASGEPVDCKGEATGDRATVRGCVGDGTGLDVLYSERDLRGKSRSAM